MGIITKIEVQKNNEERANLYLDDDFCCGISIELVIKHQLKKGIQIDEEQLKEMILEDEKGVAPTKAIKYIGSSLKTKKQIKEYLKKKEYNDISIDYVIDKLIEYKYLDDFAYAKSYILTYSSKYGKMKLVSQLKCKGVDENIIEDVFCEVTPKDSIVNTANKYLKNKEITKELLVKLNRFLYSRGYEYEEINRLIEKIKEENLC